MTASHNGASPPGRVRNILVCEDVRREANNKEMLIGLYSRGIRFGKPAPGKLRQLVFRVELDIEEKCKLKFRLVSPSGATIIDFKTDIEVEKAGRGVFNIVDPDRSFYEEGPYKMLVSFNEAEPEPYDVLEVTFEKSV